MYELPPDVPPDIIRSEVSESGATLIHYPYSLTTNTLRQRNTPPTAPRYHQTSIPERRPHPTNSSRDPRTDNHQMYHLTYRVQKAWRGLRGKGGRRGRLHESTVRIRQRRTPHANHARCTAKHYRCESITAKTRCSRGTRDSRKKTTRYSTFRKIRE